MECSIRTHLCWNHDYIDEEKFEQKKEKTIQRDQLSHEKNPNLLSIILDG